MSLSNSAKAKLSYDDLLKKLSEKFAAAALPARRTRDRDLSDGIPTGSRLRGVWANRDEPRPVPSYTQMYTARLRNEMITRVFRSIKRRTFSRRATIFAPGLSLRRWHLINAFSQQYAGARIELGMRSTEQLVWEVCSRPICRILPRAAGAEVPSASARAPRRDRPSSRPS